jgi:hypothetical protein
MSEQKHTPGPWELAWEQGKHGVVASAAGGKLVAIIGNNTPDDGNEPIRLANARLIAAAPELLEAAKLVLAWYEAEEDFSKEPDFFKRVEMCRQSEIAIRAAIAKVESK